MKGKKAYRMSAFYRKEKGGEGDLSRLSAFLSV